jgi:hypothetical protein
MKVLTPVALTPDDGSLRLLRPAFPSFRPQPRRPSDGRFPQSSQRQRLFQASPLPSRLATDLRRIGFVLLQTDGSPPAASHPASRRRSCLRLQSYDTLWRGLPPRRQGVLADALGGRNKSGHGDALRLCRSSLHNRVRFHGQPCAFVEMTDNPLSFHHLFWLSSMCACPKGPAASRCCTLIKARQNEPFASNATRTVRTAS